MGEGGRQGGREGEMEGRRGVGCVHVGTYPWNALNVVLGMP